MRVAAVQLTTGVDRDANLAAAADLVAEAATAGAGLVVLPELFSHLAPGAALRAGTETLDGPTLTWAAEQACRHGIWLVAGSVALQPGEVGLTGTGGSRFANVSCLLDPAGGLAATYAKLHLFDNDVPGAAFRESDSVVAGTQVVTAAVDGTVVGMSICYDLRFGELYRALAGSGAEVVVLPAAFTAVTGRAHWEVLVRARAIENQCVVVAAGQVGRTGNGMDCHGHSMVVGPWGEVLASAGGTGAGVVVADVDADHLAEVRQRLPVARHRRHDLFPP